MKTKIKITAAVTLCGAVFAVAGCTSNTNSTSDNSAATSDNSAASNDTSPQSLNDVFNARYAATYKMCEAYDSLVNQGWTNDEIFNQLNDAGAWDGYEYGAKDVWHALIRWCYANQP